MPKLSRFLSLRFRLPAFVMRALVLVLFGTSASLVSETSEAKQEFSVHKVQLYSSQALVTRMARKTFRKGVNRFLIEGLPAGLLADSVRVRFQNPNGLKIREIRVDMRYHKAYPSQKAERVERMLRNAESRLRRLTARYKLLEEEDRYLRSIHFAAPPKDPKAAESTAIHLRRWRESLDFRLASLKKNHVKKMDLQEKIDAAREELLVAMTLAERYKSKRKKISKAVEIVVEAASARSSSVELSYRLKGAFWYPVYAVRVLTDAGSASSRARVRLLSYALVQNKTGEDWKNVRLSFSAADPAETVEVLSLRSWKIRPVEREIAVLDNEADDAINPFPQQSKQVRVRKPYSRKKRAKRKGEYSKTTAAKANRRPSQTKEAISSYIQGARNYYLQNQAELRTKRSRKRSQKSERILNEYKLNRRAQTRALGRGDYAASLKYSEAILANLRHLPPRYQGWFEEERREIEEKRAMSLRMIENQKLIRRLIRPSLGTRGFDYRYVAVLKENILSDGSFHKIFLGEQKLDASLSYETAPLKSLHAFLVGKVEYKGSMPLLAGPVSVFHNSDYLGEARLKSISAGRPFEVHLGSDENIEVSRSVQSYRTSGGLIGKTFRYEKEIRIRLRNLNRSPVVIDVFERIPYSSDERISIKPVSLSPRPVQTDKERGLYRFRIRIAAGKTRNLTLRYSMEHPSDVIPVFRNAGGRW